MSTHECTLRQACEAGAWVRQAGQVVRKTSIPMMMPGVVVVVQYEVLQDVSGVEASM
jgi:hypothetical protein